MKQIDTITLDLTAQELDDTLAVLDEHAPQLARDLRAKLGEEHGIPLHPDTVSAISRTLRAVDALRWKDLRAHIMRQYCEAGFGHILPAGAIQLYR